MMRVAFIAIALFMLFAWDFAMNDADLFWAINEYLDEILRYLGLR
jgi:hypothetical protein